MLARGLCRGVAVWLMVCVGRRPEAAANRINAYNTYLLMEQAGR